MRRSRRNAVAIFGLDQVRAAEEDPEPVELGQDHLQQLATLARAAVPRGTQAWFLRVRTYVMELPRPQRLAAIRTIAGGARGEVERLAHLR